MPSNRIARAIEMLTVLQSHRRVTTGFLAQTLGCSRRTVFRDLNLLRDAGFHVAFDSANQTLVATGSAPQPALSDAQWQAVLLATGLSPISHMDHFSRDLCQGMAKLTALAPRYLRESTNNLLQTLGSAFEGDDSNSPKSPWLSRILEAASRRRRLRISFQDKGHTEYSTQLSPLRVFATKAGWIVRGHSTRHQSVVDIPISCIRQAEILSQTFVPPPAYLRHNRSHRPLLSEQLANLPRHTAAATDQ